MPTYRTGRTEYRGHKPGTVFPAQLEPRAEARALARGSITRLDSAAISLEAAALTLPSTIRDPDQEPKP